MNAWTSTFRSNVLSAVAAVLLFAPVAGAAMFRDIDALGITVNDEDEIRGEFNLIGEAGEPDTITIGAPYLSTPAVISDVLGFPAGTGVTIHSAVVMFYIRNGDRGEEVEVEIELLGREIKEVEFETSFKVLGKTLNANLRGKISETGIADYVLEIEGPATVDFASLEIQSNAAAPMPEPSAALLFLAGLAVSSRSIRSRRTH
ncbi:MAG: hypothetical protein JRG96_13725 [Deltaproteobacteria bacterium]|nr:hypothetical protein [Deltaproteobacteria bacterium]